MFDNYQHHSIADNQAQAYLLASAVRALACFESNKIIHMSYEDSGMYDAGDNILDHTEYIINGIDRLPPQHSIALVDKSPGTKSLDLIAFKKPPNFTSFLAGDLSLTIALLAKLEPQKAWPHNLTIGSNDPRQTHMLALSNDLRWMRTNNQTLSLKDFIIVAQPLRNKLLNFKLSPQLSSSSAAYQKIASMVNELGQAMREQEIFYTNFLSPHSSVQLDMSLKEAETLGVDLEKIHQFLLQTKNNVDIYAHSESVITHSPQS